MPYKKPQSPMLAVVPVTGSPSEKKNGRPRKLVPPAPPNFSMTDYEQQVYDYVINSYLVEYPDLTPTDHLYLPLIAAEYIKYLRVVQKEFTDGEVLSQARQHPYTQLKGLLDALSITRKQRAKQPAEDPNKNLLEEWGKALN